MNNQTLLAGYAYLTGVICALFANASPSGPEEWILWFAAIASSFSMTVIVWTGAQLDVTNRMTEDHYRELHAVFSYEVVIKILEREERFEDAAKLKAAKEQLQHK
jgi:hypothetical protein